MVRRRRNKIDGLFNDTGILCEDPMEMKAIAVNHFVNLFSAHEENDSRFLIPLFFPSLDQTTIAQLESRITPEEVKSSLFNIGGLKAPGFDGFPAHFFQNHWDLIGQDIIDLVIHAFRTGHIPSGLNHTLITLVPKCNSPQSMHLFRPISLCSTMYKVISKVLVARLRPLLSQLISPNQVSFVPGRHISDNIMIAQEMLHKCKNSTGKKVL